MKPGRSAAARPRRGAGGPVDDRLRHQRRRVDRRLARRAELRLIGEGPVERASHRDRPAALTDRSDGPAPGRRARRRASRSGRPPSHPATKAECTSPLCRQRDALDLLLALLVEEAEPDARRMRDNTAMVTPPSTRVTPSGGRSPSIAPPAIASGDDGRRVAAGARLDLGEVAGDQDQIAERVADLHVVLRRVRLVALDIDAQVAPAVPVPDRR